MSKKMYLLNTFFADINLLHSFLDRFTVHACFSTVIRCEITDYKNKKRMRKV